jgi:WD repeat-containing protein 26
VGRAALTLDPFSAPPTAAEWMKDNESFIISSLDSARSVELWTTEGELLFRWAALGAPPMTNITTPADVRILDGLPGSPPSTTTPNGPLRLYDMALSRDGRRLVCAAENAIVVFDWTARTRLAEHRMRRGEIVTSLNISADGQTMLVSLSPDGLQLMAVDSGAVLRCFEGHSQNKFLIRSAFGGASEGFVVSGSEGL